MKIEHLTQREKDTAELAIQGLRNKEIAQRLSLKESTVEQYLSHVYEKVGVDNRTQLARSYEEFSTGNH
jgi:DNA-binding NarL/FixJ family response regulator